MKQSKYLNEIRRLRYKDSQVILYSKVKMLFTGVLYECEKLINNEPLLSNKLAQLERCSSVIEYKEVEDLIIESFREDINERTFIVFNNKDLSFSTIRNSTLTSIEHKLRDNAFLHFQKRTPEEIERDNILGWNDYTYLKMYLQIDKYILYRKYFELREAKRKKIRDNNISDLVKHLEDTFSFHFKQELHGNKIQDKIRDRNLLHDYLEGIASSIYVDRSEEELIRDGFMDFGIEEYHEALNSILDSQVALFNKKRLEEISERCRSEMIPNFPESSQDENLEEIWSKVINASHFCMRKLYYKRNENEKIKDDYYLISEDDYLDVCNGLTHELSLRYKQGLMRKQLVAIGLADFNIPTHYNYDFNRDEYYDLDEELYGDY